MTLTPEQWEIIYEGIPDSFLDGSHLTKFRSQQFVNRLSTTSFPLCVVTIVSQGIPVEPVKLLEDNILDIENKVRSERWGQHCRARISASIEALGIPEVEKFASFFSQELYRLELGINPIDNKMQFRGADPPQSLPPYYDPQKKMNVQRVVVDFFVEYEFSWLKNFELIYAVEAEVNGSETFDETIQIISEE